MDTEFTDGLEILGLVTGALLVVGGLVTLAGAPWATMDSLLAAVFEALGVLATIAIGIVLAWVVRTRPRAA
ncbi:MAG: hypothetical protein ABEJ31_14610 [Haloarculaceae archaeon]